MTLHNQSTGKLGEDTACKYLLDNGFNIVDRNVRSRWGELDIVAEKNTKIYFVEVKTRRSTVRGHAFENVHEVKVSHLTRAVQYYIMANRLHARKFQCDIVTVMLEEGLEPVVKRYENIELKVVI